MKQLEWAYFTTKRVVSKFKRTDKRLGRATLGPDRGDVGQRRVMSSIGSLT